MRWTGYVSENRGRKGGSLFHKHKVHATETKEQNVWFVFHLFPAFSRLALSFSSSSDQPLIENSSRIVGLGKENNSLL